jgi:hypothetical protein
MNSCQRLEHVIPLAAYIGAIVVFSVFIFTFYKFFARKEMFELNLTQYNLSRHPFLSTVYHVFLYLLEYAIIFPLVTFAWFLLISISIGIVTENVNPERVFFISMAVAGAVRMTSYYHQNLSEDLAKTLPMALLGVFIVQSDVMSYQNSLDVIKALPVYIPMLLYYLAFVVLLEFSLRITHAIRFLILKKDGFGKKSHEDHDDTH